MTRSSLAPGRSEWIDSLACTADGQSSEPVLEMDDQRFAGKYVQRRRRIEIASRAAPVGRRAADHLILEKQKVLDGRGYRIESCPALPRGEPDFEDTFLARQRYRLSELWPNCGICSFVGSCAQAVAPGHSSATGTARAAIVSNLRRRPAWNAAPNESLCMIKGPRHSPL